MPKFCITLLGCLFFGQALAEPIAEAANHVEVPTQAELVCKAIRDDAKLGESERRDRLQRNGCVDAPSHARAPRPGQSMARPAPRDAVPSPSPPPPPAPAPPPPPSPPPAPAPAPSIQPTAAEPGTIYPVWFGTNRTPLKAADEAKGYASGRDAQIHFGKAFVYVPKGHHFGSTGADWYLRVFNGDEPLNLRSIVPMKGDAFFEDLRSTLANSGDGTLLIYIHGFDVTFQEAAIRAAQIGYDLNVNGATALYSWPSKGNLEGYGADEASVEAAEGLLAEFITKIASNAHAKHVHIIAHSMGNLGLVRAVNRATTQAALQGVKFDQIFLAAPDVDAELFRQLAVVYPQISERTTLYVSSKDKALEASHWLRGDAARAGYSPPVTSVEGIDTVEVTNIDLGMLGHSYYAEAADVLHDMYDLMLHNDPPGKRIRLQPAATGDGKPYWFIKR